MTKHKDSKRIADKADRKKHHAERRKRQRRRDQWQTN